MNDNKNLKCKATTKSGNPCKMKANSSGYCHMHDPNSIARHEVEFESSKIPKHRFSQRKGYTLTATDIQVEGMSTELRISLWNIIRLSSLSTDYDPVGIGRLYYRYTDFIKDLWIRFYKESIDTLPRTEELQIKEIRNRFMTYEWYEVYDFLEHSLNYTDDVHEIAQINSILERELSGYRFVGGHITDVTNKQELEMLESTLADDEFPMVNAHLKRALALMSNRKEPDYRNSVKESISAVESLAGQIANKPNATLGDALKILGRSNTIHSALKESFLKLYGYTSDANGIRHALSGESDITAADAKFFLLSCTSFVNYLKSKM